VSLTVIVVTEPLRIASQDAPVNSMWAPVSV
jgi:hypothetical protein